jgi:hypothetical protein
MFGFGKIKKLEQRIDSLERAVTHCQRRITNMEYAIGYDYSDNPFSDLPNTPPVTLREQFELLYSYLGLKIKKEPASMSLVNKNGR